MFDNKDFSALKVHSLFINQHLYIKMKNDFLMASAVFLIFFVSGCAVDEAALKRSIASSSDIAESEIKLISHGYLTVNYRENETQFFKEGEFVFTGSEVIFYKWPIRDMEKLNPLINIKYGKIVKAGVTKGITAQIQLIEKDREVGIQLFDMVITGDKGPEKTRYAFDIVRNSGVTEFKPVELIDDGKEFDYGSVYTPDFMY